MPFSFPVTYASSSFGFLSFAINFSVYELVIVSTGWMFGAEEQ
jgi:hypothetical protein